MMSLLMVLRLSSLFYILEIELSRHLMIKQSRENALHYLFETSSFVFFFSLSALKHNAIVESKT